jgi:hypothetical protein
MGSSGSGLGLGEALTEGAAEGEELGSVTVGGEQAASKTSTEALMGTREFLGRRALRVLDMSSR